MSRSVNSITLLGLTTDAAELRYTPNGKPVTTFQVAGNQPVISDGELKEIPFYQRVTVWREAENISEQLNASGMPVLVHGKLNYRTWEDQAGNFRSSTDVLADNVTALATLITPENTVEDRAGNQRLRTGINRITAVGNATRDAQHSDTGIGFTRFTIAMNEGYLRNGEWVDKPCFVNVKAFGTLTDTAKDVTKGGLVLVEGMFVNESWEAEDGSKRYGSSINASRIELGISRTSSRKRHSRTRASSPPPAPEAHEGYYDDEFPDEDLPF